MRAFQWAAVGILLVGGASGRSVDSVPLQSPAASASVCFEEPPLAIRIAGAIEPNIPSTYDLADR